MVAAEMRPGTLLVLLILLGDGVGGLLCVRARRYWHAIGIGAVLVPACLMVAAMGFTQVSGATAQYNAETMDVLLVALGSQLMAGFAVAWMLWVGVRDVRLVNERKDESTWRGHEDEQRSWTSRKNSISTRPASPEL